MKRKALTITLAAVMAMGTCAVTASAADGDTYNIGICQLVQHDALDAATQGFKDEVIKELGEEAVTFDEQNAQGDSNTCSTIVNSFVSNNVDLILANATPALQAAAAGTSDIPILGTSVTEYGVALGLDDFCVRCNSIICRYIDHIACIGSCCNNGREIVGIRECIIFTGVSEFFQCIFYCIYLILGIRFC